LQKKTGIGAKQHIDAEINKKVTDLALKGHKSG